LAGESTLLTIRGADRKTVLRIPSPSEVMDDNSAASFGTDCSRPPMTTEKGVTIGLLLDGWADLI